MNSESGPRVRPQGFTLIKVGVMNWKSVSKSGLNTLYYLGPDGKTGAGLWARVKANLTSLPSGPRASINWPLHSSPQKDFSLTPYNHRNIGLPTDPTPARGQGHSKGMDGMVNGATPGGPTW